MHIALQLAIFRFQLANALVLGGGWFSNTAQARLLCFKLIELAPDNTVYQTHVFADLPETQALNFDHLNDLGFKFCVKASSEFLILHVLRDLDFGKTYRCVRLN